MRREWQVKFIEVVQQFAAYKTKILSGTSIPESVGNADVTNVIDAMQADIGKLTEDVNNFMKVVFGTLESREEKEVMSFVKDKSTTIGAVLPDDALLNDLLAVLESKFGKAVSYHGSSTEKDETKTMLRQLGTNKDVVKLVTDNIYFDKKFDVALLWQKDETRMSIIAHRRIDTLENGCKGIIDHVSLLVRRVARVLSCSTDLQLFQDIRSVWRNNVSHATSSVSRKDGTN